MTVEWDWLDFENRRVVWPDSKTGDMSKPMSEEAYRLLSTAPRQKDSPYVGMALTAHKTVAMFMRYVHTEDKPVREAAEVVANRRKAVVLGKRPAGQENAAAAA